MNPKVSDDYKHEIRDKILKSAKKILNEKGYYRTTMDDIVEKSNVSKGSIYNYFPSKRDLFLEIYQEWWGLSMAKIKSVLEKKLSAKDQLEELIKFGFGLKSRMEFRNYHNLLNPMFYESQDLEYSIKSKDRYNIFHEPIVKIIKRGIEEQQIRSDIDPDTTASILQAFSIGILTHWADYKLDFDWDILIKTLLKVISQGIFKEKE
ncbi:MAG: TetR/AcrR family transcriptional regulator [Candidatus Hodarchaeota archaeon]